MESTSKCITEGRKGSGVLNLAEKDSRPLFSPVLIPILAILISKGISAPIFGWTDNYCVLRYRPPQKAELLDKT